MLLFLSSLVQDPLDSLLEGVGGEEMKFDNSLQLHYLKQHFSIFTHFSCRKIFYRNGEREHPLLNYQLIYFTFSASFFFNLKITTKTNYFMLFLLRL